MRVVFRVDASFDIGTGHIIRCLTLAEKLRESGADCFFISKAHEGHLINEVLQKGFKVYQLPAADSGFNHKGKHLAHASWLGCDWKTDASQTEAILKNICPEWLIVDHYALDENWEKAVSRFYGKLMVIDDLADRRHECDLLLDQNLVDDKDSRYQCKVSENCMTLLGAEYALLQSIYEKLHHQVRFRQGRIGRILVFFGGADKHNLTGRIISVLIAFNRHDIEVDVVIAENSPFMKSVCEQVRGCEHIFLHSGLSTLGHLMLKADLAIGAGGVSSWERLCLGLPTLVITMAENQIGIADYLFKQELIKWMGHYDNVCDQQVFRALGNLLDQGYVDESWSKRCWRLVDGKGVGRVCSLLMIDSSTSLYARHVEMKDQTVLLKWANDQVTRRNSFSMKKITTDVHNKWFCDQIKKKEDSRIYIVETKVGLPIGSVRFERKELGWEIHFTLGSIYRGKGLSGVFLNVAITKFYSELGDVVLLARVKDQNESSKRLLIALGFQLMEQHDSKIDGYNRYQLQNNSFNSVF